MKRQLREVGLLPFHIEQNIRWSRERLAWRVANHAKRKERNSVLGTGARNEFRFHVRRDRPRGLRHPVPFLTRFDH